MPKPALACQPADDALAELATAADAHEMSSHFGPNDATWSQMLAAVRRARAELDRDRLTFRERIAAQNAALRIARTVVNYTTGQETTLSRELLGDAADLIAWLAPPPDQFQSVDADAEIAGWFGPPNEWREQRVSDAPALFHEHTYFLTRAFRALRVGERHFIFSQLVAVDNAWRPHVTGVVGDMEMRNEAGGAMSACIAEFDAAWSRCGAPAGLRALDRLPISHLGGYVRVEADGTANCASCHVGGQVLGMTPRDLPARDVNAYLTQRRARLLALLGAELAAIRAAGEAAPN